MCAADHKRVVYGVLGDLLVTLTSIFTVYVYLYFVIMPKAESVFPKHEGIWQQAEIQVSFILLLVWIALEAGAFCLILRSHFTRILAAVTLANVVLFFLKLSNEWLFSLLFGSPAQLAETDPQALLNTAFLWPLAMLALMVIAKAVLYAAALRQLPAKRVLLGALHANLIALALLYGSLGLWFAISG